MENSILDVGFWMMIFCAFIACFYKLAEQALEPFAPDYEITWLEFMKLVMKRMMSHVALGVAIGLMALIFLGFCWSMLKSPMMMPR